MPHLEQNLQREELGEYKVGHVEELAEAGRHAVVLYGQQDGVDENEKQKKVVEVLQIHKPSQPPLYVLPAVLWHPIPVLSECGNEVGGGEGGGGGSGASYSEKI